jgi:N-methylhydantoinase A
MSDHRRPLTLAIDIGGTFTDLVAVDRRDGSLILSKVATTPSRLQRGALSALERLRSSAGRRGGVRPRQHRRD